MSFCGNCGAEVSTNAPTCSGCNAPVAGRGLVNSRAAPNPTGDLRVYEYHAEFVSISEKWLGHTSSGSSARDISERFNYLAGQGWELIAMSAVPVVGKVFKANEERTVTLAVWRKAR